MKRSDFIISVLLHVGLLSVIVIASSARSGATQFDPDEIANVEILDQLPMGGGPPPQQQPEPEPEPEPVPVPDMPTEMATDVQVEDPVKLTSITEPAELEVEKIKEKKPVTKPEEKPKPKPQQPKAQSSGDSEKDEGDSKTVVGEGEVKTSIGVGSGTGAGGVGDFPYDIRRAVQLIDRNWDNPVLSQKTLRCTVYFQVDRNGDIKGATVEESSGHSQFDMYALAAVMRTGELPPLPANYRYDVLGFHLEFEYTP